MGQKTESNKWTNKENKQKSYTQTTINTFSVSTVFLMESTDNI